mgnify:CR=1 FL=1
MIDAPGASPVPIDGQLTEAILLSVTVTALVGASWYVAWTVVTALNDSITVLNNLVGNAVKYTKEGEIRVSVIEDGVIVEDTGSGITAEEAGQLFDRHVRGSSAGSTSGAGLGLAIVKRLCALYGWTAELEPRLEGGARASLRF